MKVAIVNLGQIVSGDWRKPLAEGDTILIDGETIASITKIVIDQAFDRVNAKLAE